MTIRLTPGYFDIWSFAGLPPGKLFLYTVDSLRDLINTGYSYRSDAPTQRNDFKKLTGYLYKVFTFNLYHIGYLPPGSASIEHPAEFLHDFWSSRPDGSILMFQRYR